MTESDELSDCKTAVMAVLFCCKHYVCSNYTIETNYKV